MAPVPRQDSLSFAPRKGMARFMKRLKRLPQFELVFILATALVLLALIAHRSSDPWIFGRYSLSYALFFVLSAAAITFLGILFHRFKLRALYILAASLLALTVSVLLLEIIGQTYAFLHPSYRVLAYEPDRVVGWKLVPNLRWTWAGHQWYAKDFSVDIQTNSEGFRDLDRHVMKPDGVVRIALLGDSMVEAVQVPFEKTAGYLLEKRLSADAGGKLGRADSYEVLNFGISNYGVGQYLLCWEEYGRKFGPDYVFIFVAGFHLRRTVTKYEFGAFPQTNGKRLWVRPTFRLENGVLVRESARDFDDFVKLQHEVLRTEFGGERMRRRSQRLFVEDFFGQVWRSGRDVLMAAQKRFTGQEAEAGEWTRLAANDLNEETVLEINLRAIEALAHEVEKQGGRLVVVDTIRFFWAGSAELSRALQRFSVARGVGYLPLSDRLLEAQRRGIATRWAHDGHFNETGNEIFAEAMYRWLAVEGTRIHR